MKIETIKTKEKLKEVFAFVTIDNMRKENNFNLQEKLSWQGLWIYFL